jgi:hypothetical protein
MPNGHLSLEPGGPRVCQVFSSYKRTSENAGRVNFLESRLGEVGPSPCLLARGRAHKSPTRWPRALACTKTATTSHRTKEGPSGRMGRTTVLLTPTIANSRYRAHRPDGLSSYAKPSLLPTNFAE